MHRHWKWFIPIFKLYKVSGDSMSPTLLDGEYVVTKKPRSIRPGFIYVIDHVDLGRIIKRLERIEKERYFFTGDGADSVPQNILATVTSDRLVAEVRLKIGPSGIKRVL